MQRIISIRSDCNSGRSSRRMVRLLHRTEAETSFPHGRCSRLRLGNDHFSSANVLGCSYGYWTSMGYLYRHHFRSVVHELKLVLLHLFICKSKTKYYFLDIILYFFYRAPSGDMLLVGYRINFLKIYSAQLYFSYLQYVVIPPRRATAGALMVLTSHALGDAISPYLIGLV